MPDLSADDIAEAKAFLAAVLAEPSPSTYTPLLNWVAQGTRWRALLEAAEAVERIRAIHTPTRGHNPDCGCGIPPHADRSCTECRTAWPCATLRAITPEENHA